MRIMLFIVKKKTNLSSRPPRGLEDLDLAGSLEFFSSLLVYLDFLTFNILFLDNL